jgi:plasmid maintenance system antidote protein VapI
MSPQNPGTFIRDEILEELGLSVSEAADERQRSPLAGNGAADREGIFGVDMEMLLRMQAWHDANAMRRRAGEIDVKRFQPASGPH